RVSQRGDPEPHGRVWPARATSAQLQPADDRLFDVELHRTDGGWILDRLRGPRFGIPGLRAAHAPADRAPYVLSPVHPDRDAGIGEKGAAGARPPARSAAAAR